MFYDYICAGCGHHEERQVSYESRDKQLCQQMNVEGSEHPCLCSMIRQPHYQSLAIHPQGVEGVFQASRAKLLDPDAYPGKRARLDSMNGFKNSSEYDEQGRPLAGLRR